MHIERTKDKCHVSHHEIQRLLRDYIEKETGRKIDKEDRTIHIHTETDRGTSGGGSTWTVTVRLADEPKAAGGDE